MRNTIAAWSGNDARKCPKCERECYADPRWCAKMACHRSDRNPTTVSDLLPEHMHRTCEFCEFVWLELPADAKPSITDGSGG